MPKGHSKRSGRAPVGPTRWITHCISHPRGGAARLLPAAVALPAGLTALALIALISGALGSPLLGALVGLPAALAALLGLATALALAAGLAAAVLPSLVPAATLAALLLVRHNASSALSPLRASCPGGENDLTGRSWRVGCESRDPEDPRVRHSI